MRATISAFGPILLSKVLGLNATQESTLGLIFHWADQQGLPLLDLKDLRSVITYLTSDEGKATLKTIGGGCPHRPLVSSCAPWSTLKPTAVTRFFGEPEIDPADLLRVDAQGAWRDHAARARRPGGSAGDVLDVSDVGAGRPVHLPA